MRILSSKFWTWQYHWIACGHPYWQYQYNVYLYIYVRHVARVPPPPIFESRLVLQLLAFWSMQVMSRGCAASVSGGVSVFHGDRKSVVEDTNIS